MNFNNKVRKTIKYFYINEWNVISLEVTCENIYFIFLNGTEPIINTCNKSEAEHIFQELKNDIY